MKGGIRYKFLLPTVSLIVIGMGIVTILTYSASKRALEDAVSAQLEQTTKEMVKSIEAWVRDRKLDVNTWSEQNVYQTAVKDSFLGKTARKGAVAELNNLKNKYGYYQALMLSDGNGNVVAATEGADVYGERVEDRDYFRAAKNGSIFVSDVDDVSGEGSPVFFISSPVIDKEAVVGVLVGAIGLDIVSAKNLDDLKLGSTGHAFMLDRDGRALAYPDKSKVLKLNFTDYDFGKKMLAEAQGMLAYSFEGMKMLASYRRCEELGWTVVFCAGTDELLAPARKIGYISFMIAIGVVSLTIVVLVLVSNSVARPVKHIAEKLKDIADGEGDLTVSLDEKGVFEIAMLSNGFNRFARKIQTLVGDVQSSSTRLASMSMELAASAQENAATNEETSSQANSMAKSAEELNATVEAVAQNTSTVSASSNEAHKVAAMGANVIAETLEALKRITESVNETGDTVHSLAAKLENIRKVVDVIEDIADQTNLLALNAAIEAARAGEQGRGFAVVADEVRKLAEKTVKSTKEITSMIASIEVESNKSVNAVARGQEFAIHGESLGLKSGEAVETIEREVRSVSEQVAQIAAATQQMTATISEMASGTNQIANAMEASATSIDGVSTTAESVAQLADELMSLSKRFKI